MYTLKLLTIYVSVTRETYYLFHKTSTEPPPEICISVNPQNFYKKKKIVQGVWFCC